ncbi:hypothetical protein FG386_000196 [Cryptosporidium ryanae]|uniref:uncharacterized protein n=1 Tax=Cryptosporidium ryanae TaxID=515981 RepID=UPI00351A2248|nr:hypothetical protein FG386_000196 [Cryptosporidium ryanae]
MSGNTNQHISEFLSEYLENLLDSLSNAKFIQVIEDCDELKSYNSDEDDNNKIDVAGDEISPQNLCLISAFYNIKVSSIEFISRNMTVDDTYDSLLRLISLTPLLQESCIIRKGDINMIVQLSKDICLNTNNKGDKLVSRKILVLLNSYLKRHKFCLARPIIKADICKLINSVMRIIYPMVDISSSFGWTKTTLKIMELCQMFVQAVKNPSSDKLKQLPGINTNDQVKIFNELGVFDIYDLISLEDERRMDLLYNKLGLFDETVNKIAKICNKFPIIEVEYNLIQVDNDNCDESGSGREVSNIKRRKTENSVIESTRMFEFNAESEVMIIVNVNRDLDPDEVSNDQITLYDLEYYPLEEKKVEKWWVVLLESNNDDNSGFSLKEKKKPQEKVSIQDEGDERIVGIKITTLSREKNEIALKFSSNTESDKVTNYKLLLICDSYIGCDQEFHFRIKT